MKKQRIVWLAVGGFAVAALFMAPRAAHAVTATLVQVVNTTSNPVPNFDTERNARVPYESGVIQKCTLSPCQFGFTTVPTGYRLVAQNVSSTLILSGLATAPFGTLTDTFTHEHSLPGALGPSDCTTAPAGFNQNLVA